MTVGIETCPGCGIRLPAAGNAEHPYMIGSAACWQGYGQLLARQYADPERMAFHQLVVDSYAVQHPGGQRPQQVQSVGIHLMTLALFLEDGVDPALGTSLHGEMVVRPVFEYLPRPVTRDELTFAHVPLVGPAPKARIAAYEWARAAWALWQPHHQTVDAWLRTSGLR